MSNDSKEIMARNIKKYMKAKGITRQQICDDLDLKYSTFRDCVKGITYPRIDKIDAMAGYFGVRRGDLVDEKTEAQLQMQKKNDTLTDIVLRLRSDDKFLSVVKTIYDMDDERLSSLSGFLK